MWLCNFAPNPKVFHGAWRITLHPKTIFARRVFFLDKKYRGFNRRWLEIHYNKGAIKKSAVQRISRSGSLALEPQSMSKSTFCTAFSSMITLCKRLMVTSLWQTKAKTQNVTKPDTANKNQGLCTGRNSIPLRPWEEILGEREKTQST